ncbi:MAG: sigma-70 family RNA polymerase sigma factor [Bacteroidetes bacterium]|nr:sigma-70 family RNA polymerase sigma factor [Bacteroidota bacterium]
MVESTVIKAAIKRERGAFQVIYESCAPYAYAIVRRYISNTNDHKDILQEAFARLFLSLHTFDTSKGDFKPWLRKIIINQCMQHLRKNQKNAVVVPLNHTNEEPKENLEAELTKLSKSDIERLLTQMPEGYRQVFMLVAIDDYTHKEAGKLLDISPETSRSQFFRARKWLKKHLISDNYKTLANGL